MIYGLHSIKSKTKILLITADQESCDTLIQNGYAAIYLNGSDSTNIPQGHNFIVWPGQDKRESVEHLISTLPAKLIDTPLSAKQMLAKGATTKEINALIASVAKNNDKIDDHIAPMGYDTEYHYYFKKAKKILIALTTNGHSKNNYLSMAPMSAWQAWAGTTKKLTVDEWDSITDKLMRKCESMGYFTAEKIRGRGTWFDDNRVVVHLGNRLLVDSKEYKLGNIETNYVYQIGDSLPSLNANPLDKEESEFLLDTCRHLRWQNPSMGVLLAGFMALVPIAGCLEWRPHIYITGSKQSGKTTVMRDIVQHALGPWAVTPEAGSTEPGIRQALQHDARAVIYDEAGIENENDRIRMEQVFKLARSASSNDGKILKGNSTGSGMSFTVKGMFAFASVNPNIENDQDQSRIAMLTLKSAIKGDAGAAMHYDQLLAMLAKLTDDYCARLHARSIANVRTTLENIRIFRTVCQAEYGDARKGDQFGSLFAGAYSLTSNEIIDTQEAKNWIERYSIEAAFMGPGTIDEERCWDHLMQYKVAYSPSQKIPVGEMIGCIMKYDPECEFDLKSAAKELSRMGIKCDPDNKIILVASQAIELKRIFTNTPWRDYIPILSKLPFYYPQGNRNSRVCGTIKTCYAFKYD